MTVFESCRVLNQNIVVVYAEPLYPEVPTDEIKREYSPADGWAIVDMQPPGVLVIQNPTKKEHIQIEGQRLTVGIAGSGIDPSKVESQRLVGLLGQVREVLPKRSITAFGVNLEIELTLQSTAGTSREAFLGLMPAAKNAAAQLGAADFRFMPSMVLHVDNTRYSFGVQLPDSEGHQFKVKSNAHRDAKRLPPSRSLAKFVDDALKFDCQILEMMFGISHE